MPGFFAAVMIALFAMQYFSRASGLTTVLWAATMLAVIARLAMSVRENKRLLEQVRTDPLTGLGNQGCMQVDLANRCQLAAEEPLTLLLLDLNGFKRFNDTSGHPAGDAMLTRLGTQLKRAVGRGRLGLPDRRRRVRRADRLRSRLMTHLVSKRAAEALTARGKGFELSASWGAVSIPTEAETPSAAMQLADVRMYAQKRVAPPFLTTMGSRSMGADVEVRLRTSARRQSSRAARVEPPSPRPGWPGRLSGPPASPPHRARRAAGAPSASPAAGGSRPPRSPR